MIWLILFTIFIVCLLFWFGVLAAVLAGVGYLIYYAAIAAGWIAFTIVGSLIWLAWFCVQPRKAWATLQERESHFHVLPKAKRYRAPDPMPSVKIYRAKR
ncbi:MAG: hypothetical protein ACM3W4_04225 [Ignavibacteriales bacterium]